MPEPDPVALRLQHQEPISDEVGMEEPQPLPSGLRIPAVSSMAKAMMKRIRRTRTSVEKHEVFVIKSSRRLKRVFCPECSEPVALVTLDEAVKISGISSRAVYRLIEEGRIHFAEAADRVARICPATLLKSVWKEDEGRFQPKR